MNDLDYINTQLAELSKQEQVCNILLKVALVLTFGFYVMFGMNLYLGSPLTWESYFTNWQGTTGFILMSALVVGVAVFLSWTKHFAYIYFGIFGSVLLVLVTVIGFAIFAEFFTSSANQDEKSHILLEKNSAYQATIGQPATTGSIDPSLALLIANAQQKLARCKEKLKAGKEKHCEGDRAKLTGLQQSLQRAIDAQKQASLELQQLNNDRQDKLKADSYNPAIVTVAKIYTSLLGGHYTDHIKTAVVSVMLFVAICFEVLHHFLSGARANIRSQNLNLGMALKQTTAKYSADENLNLENQPEAVQAQFKYQNLPQHSPTLAKAELSAQPSIGFINTNTPDTHQSQLEQWEKGLADHGVPSPVDPALSSHEDKAVIDRIVQKCLDDSAHPETVSESVSVHPGKVSEECVHTLETVSDQLYEEWVQKLKSRELKPTVRPARTLVSNRLCQQVKEKTLTLIQIDQMVTGWMDRAVGEGILKLNPDRGKGKAKYLLVK